MVTMTITLAAPQERAPAPLTTVYSYYLPEVREVVDEVAARFPHELLLGNVHPGLDDLHVPLIERFESVHAGNVRGWAALPHRYPTGGSSEGLFHLLARHAAQEPGVPLYQLAGEYQGYRAYAVALGLTIADVAEDEVATLPPGRFLLSHPSARDGDRLAPELLAAILDRHRAVLDLCYLGMTEPLGLDVSHPNVDAVVASFSKPYGLYYFRLGLCWSREPIASLYATRWFKNAFSIEVGKAVLDRLDLGALRARYRHAQALAVERASDDLGAELEPSEVWLLARRRGLRLPPALEPYRRGDGARVCLTEYLMQAEHA